MTWPDVAFMAIVCVTLIAIAFAPNNVDKTGRSVVKLKENIGENE